MVQLLQKNFEAGLIDLSQKGEVVMCLLLRMAYMNATTTKQADENDPTGKLNFSKGCNVIRFLKALFANEFHGQILRAVDKSVMSTKSMVSAFLRGAALICQNQQKAIDIIIPILLDRHSILKESLMSVLFIQVKQWWWQRQGSSTAYVIDDQVHGFFLNKVSTGEQENTRPYMTLVAELGTDSPPKKMSFVVTGNNGKHSSKEHARYSIRAYTCTEAVWKVISAMEHDMYKHVLDTDDFVPDHPRQDEASLDLVQQMLPFWHNDAIWYNDNESDSMDAVEFLEQTGEGVGM
ncbi:hypothetical protein EDD16DRAFT_1517604 [Pisolithus croceorrhizus]|nr:hypothetical protein EV401DRAFT_1889864 [Pisolithus croceorrhizus]KAI6124166.1 hypothetical protein EDD16DRAFT_1517604 [Pisolithus croceorrhizus]KAI6159953.1 hypothetical protein EDD17DRAFT_1510869 [Pisolithus thermaeus]